eukprot:691404-Prymnesium_polylepis.2
MSSGKVHLAANAACRMGFAVATSQTLGCHTMRPRSCNQVIAQKCPLRAASKQSKANGGMQGEVTDHASRANEQKQADRRVRMRR